MRGLRTAHASELDAATLIAARALLDDVFEGEFSDDDWDHGLGGVHALAWDGGELVGHASVVQRRLLHGDRTLRAGYVEGLGVRREPRRRGHAGAWTARSRATGARATSGDATDARAGGQPQQAAIRPRAVEFSRL